MFPRETRRNDTNVVRWLLIAFTLVIVLMAIWLVRDVLLLSLTAVIFAILLTTPIRFFVRHGINRIVAVLLTVFLISLVIAATSALALPDLFEQFRILVVQTLPSAGQVLQRELAPENLTLRFPFLRDFMTEMSLADLTNQLSQQIVSGLATVSGQVFPFVTNLFSALFSLLIVIFLSIYFVADPDPHWRGLLRLVPIGYRPRAREILLSLDYTLRQFLQTQIILMILTGTLTTIAMLVLGLPLAGVLGVIGGLFSFVPNFGPLVALVPVLAVTILNSPEKVLLVLLVYFGIQFVVGQIVAPLLLGKEIQLPPAIILLSQIIFGIFFGFLGLLLSVPLAAIGVVLIREVYVRDVLGDTEASLRVTQEFERVLD
ncbi:MAG: AI-2E family transporter [Chloroflexi bacterium CFX4]|nr:AI-2E family transporter [Chloroflexi bacterium CFX4]MDL1922580.1 AI-2E family transporter [Chloroflexi bacterium CFX3]